MRKLTKQMLRKRILEEIRNLSDDFNLAREDEAYKTGLPSYGPEDIIPNQHIVESDYIDNLEYKLEKGLASVIIDIENTEDIKAKEDSWAGGQNLQQQVDHLKDGGSNEKSVKGIEREKIEKLQEENLSRGSLYKKHYYGRY